MERLIVCEFFCPLLFPDQCQGIAGSLQVLCRFSDQGQGFAGSLQLSGLVSGVFRFSAGFLISLRGLQVLCRYPGQCQGFAGSRLVSRSVSGVCKNWPSKSFDSAFPWMSY